MYYLIVSCLPIFPKIPFFPIFIRFFGPPARHCKVCNWKSFSDIVGGLEKLFSRPEFNSDYDKIIEYGKSFQKA